MSIEVTVKGKNIEVTDGLKSYTEKRLQKLSKYLPNCREAIVRECVERNQHRVEVTLEGDGLILRGEERTDNMYASVDLVLDKLEQRARKFKERHSHETHHNESIRKNIAADNDGPFGGEILPAETPEDVDSRPYISRTKRVTMKPMSAEEASERMVLADHDFFIYQDADSQQVQVIYRRKDGNYGLIMPKL
jgi:putative sigma-54 modulation protein